MSEGPKRGSLKVLIAPKIPVLDFPAHDWTYATPTMRGINQYFSGTDHPKFTRPGWYRRGASTVLLVKLTRGWRVYVWTTIDPREELAKVLALPMVEPSEDER